MLKKAVFITGLIPFVSFRFLETGCMAFGFGKRFISMRFIMDFGLFRFAERFVSFASETKPDQILIRADFAFSRGSRKQIWRPAWAFSWASKEESQTQASFAFSRA